MWELKGDYLIFEKADNFPELSDTDWLYGLTFAVGILTYMIELNPKPQGKDQFVHELCTNIRTFKTKLTLFLKQMSFTHFPTLATLKEAP